MTKDEPPMTDAETLEIVEHEHRPRIPNTPQRARLEYHRSIREVVFGAQDGVLTTLGLVTGIGAAHQERATLLIAGFISMFVGALSMGVGEYLGGKSEREVVQNAITLESQEIAEKPEEEFQEQLVYYRLKGFTQAEAEMIVRRLMTQPEIWLHEMMRDEFGIDPRIVDDTSLKPALFLGLTFAVGATVPILPHLLPISDAAASLAALGLAALMLFAIGYTSGSLSGRHPIKKGLEIVFFGTAVFVLSYLAGRYVPSFFGHASVAV